MKAERVRDLVLARAQTLTYAGARRVADLAHNTGIGLWLWSATERPTSALAQLLEARPHKQATVGNSSSAGAVSRPTRLLTVPESIRGRVRTTRN